MYGRWRAVQALTGVCALVACSVCLAVVPAGRAAADSSRTFPETGKTVSGKFLTYWDQHGGLAQQGYPISNEMQEVSETNGKTYTVQYFERAIFELHPENQPPYDVLLSLLGVFLYQQKYPSGAPNQIVNPDLNFKDFPETGHRVGGLFLDYWNSHGGLAQQGYPISDEFVEVSDLDGKPYKVQYFQRAVFEYHPEQQQAAYKVLLSQLGKFRYDARYGQSRSTATVQPGTTATPGTSCTIAVGQDFDKIWTDNSTVRSRAGCPKTVESPIPGAAQEHFQGGFMFWRADTLTIYVFVGAPGARTGTWSVFPDTWSNGEPIPTPTTAPPQGLYAPVRGFGKLWANSQSVHQALGWATDQESAVTGASQPFEHANAIRVSDGNIYFLYDDGTWQRFDATLAGN